MSNVVEPDGPLLLGRGPVLAQDFFMGTLGDHDRNPGSCVDRRDELGEQGRERKS